MIFVCPGDRLGLGDTNDRNTPTKHPFLSTVSALSPGGVFNLAIGFAFLIFFPDTYLHAFPSNQLVQGKFTHGDSAIRLILSLEFDDLDFWPNFFSRFSAM